jgi:hypothetical protein
MNNNNHHPNDIINEKTEPGYKPIYQKPKTSLFLDPKHIAGGTQSIPETNSGILS